MKPHRHQKSKRQGQNLYQLSHRANLRADAAWVLFQILEHGKSSRDVMPKVFARHETNNKAWLQEMVFGCLRELPKLQYWLRQLLDKPLKGDHKLIEHLIMLGFYQLHFSRTLEHAAVSETVEASTVLGHHGLKGLVNANLRNFQRKDIASQAIDQPHVNIGLPKWLYKQLLAQYPEQVESIATNMNERPPLWLRINHRVESKTSFCDKLNSEEIDYAEPNFENCGWDLHSAFNASAAIRLERRSDVTQLPGFDDGAFAVQDLAAQLASELLNVQPGDTVLDCCAAPGGKTAHLLESQNQLARLDAIDSDGERLERIDENMTRLGHKTHFGDRLNLYVADASSEEVLKRVLGNTTYDKILLDAPCSATGVIRRHPDIRWLRKSADIENTVELQKKILAVIWGRLKPGGTLLYATCSILKQENTEQIANFLTNNKDAKLVPLHKNESPTQPGLQILPGDAQMDGFYYARLLKSE
ncbi:16S rRNA (cytosine(967)-C(5))-methyltransferase RsmB [Glaciecola sp. MH2013]|uniref:16S rRNA (cytosine(967)-C(5))-methyltransferase RsmB n=1 Tax=Glaciecola sp. MH2013 TaxID=2785524 RepID=UPI0018A0E057|nr:16S rRNA (cytosine(967)-C(5))-methyltransferase RsmB [Glaciecola sp. MH2013]MBF7074673.1 16S rRNA (cytosine(967)-C(5))-methyltransferase RsmB [Glaciecola sp. MH2013]